MDLVVPGLITLWRTAMATFMTSRWTVVLRLVLDRLAMRNIILLMLLSPALILASPIILLATFKTALGLLIWSLRLQNLRLHEARLQTAEILMSALIAGDDRRLWWCWWWRIRLA
jgi:hypothetical protein